MGEHIQRARETSELNPWYFSVSLSPHIEAAVRVHPLSHSNKVIKNFSAILLGSEANISVVLSSEKRRRRSCRTSNIAASETPLSETTAEVMLFMRPLLSDRDDKSSRPASSKQEDERFLILPFNPRLLFPKSPHLRTRRATAFPILFFCRFSFAPSVDPIINFKTAPNPPESIKPFLNLVDSPLMSFSSTVETSAGRLERISGAGCIKESMTCKT
mmetsp:Transcript_23950/g.31810  ORF Transcript_23950/g.31810 Transcript_23950/m.31810 type:complete len:216 (-) Transcript_23950:536-1183(-)